MMYGMLVAVIALGVPPAVLLWQDYQRRRVANKKLHELSSLAASLEGKDAEALTQEESGIARGILDELRGLPYMLLRQHEALMALWRQRARVAQRAAELAQEGADEGPIARAEDAVQSDVGGDPASDTMSKAGRGVPVSEALADRRIGQFRPRTLFGRFRQALATRSGASEEWVEKMYLPAARALVLRRTAQIVERALDDSPPGALSNRDALDSVLQGIEQEFDEPSRTLALELLQGLLQEEPPDG